MTEFGLIGNESNVRVMVNASSVHQENATVMSDNSDQFSIVVIANASLTFAGLVLHGYLISMFIAYNNYLFYRAPLFLNDKWDSFNQAQVLELLSETDDQRDFLRNFTHEFRVCCIDCTAVVTRTGTIEPNENL